MPCCVTASSFTGSNLFYRITSNDWFLTFIPFPYSIADQNTTAFKEVAIIRHPRHGEYAFGFITSSLVLQVSFLVATECKTTWYILIEQENRCSISICSVLGISYRWMLAKNRCLSFLSQRHDRDEELCSVYVPTNHLYIGDIFLVNSADIIRPNLSIREGIGSVSSSWFLVLTALDFQLPLCCSFIEIVTRRLTICSFWFRDLGFGGDDDATSDISCGKGYYSSQQQQHNPT